MRDSRSALGKFARCWLISRRSIVLTSFRLHCIYLFQPTNHPSIHSIISVYNLMPNIPSRRCIAIFVFSTVFCEFFVDSRSTLLSQILHGQLKYIDSSCMPSRL